MRVPFPISLCLLLVVLMTHVHSINAQETVVASGAKVGDPTNTGAAQITIPVEVPPGRNGIAPNLTLIYDSNRGNGLIGVGWELSLGEIQRSTKKGTNYNSYDFVFIANGSSSELVRRGTSNYYDSRIEGAFSRFFFDPSGGWEVTTKDGAKYYYGTTAESRQDSSNGALVFKWCLDKVQDTNGNLMTITYVKDSYGEIYPSRIDYTGNGSLPPSNFVKLIYESRTDTPSMYTSNALVKTINRLSAIEVYGGGQLARKYVLSYEYSADTFRSLLSSVTQYGSDATSALPSTTFKWQTGGNSWTTASDIASFGTSQGYTNDNTYPIFTGDFNGDGIIDVGRVTGNGVAFYLANGTGGWSSMSGINDFSPAQGYTDGNTYPIILGDFNGDGKTDIGRVNGSGISFYLSNGAGGWTPMAGVSNFSPAQGFPNNTTHPIITGDFDGDGKTDVGRVTGNGVAFYLSTGAGWTSIGGISGNFSPAQGYSDSNIYPMVVGDFNGDGKTDIGRVHGSGISFYLSSGTGAWTSIGGIGNFSPAQSFTNGSVYPMVIGDFNGDGNTDVGRVTGSGIGFYLSDGVGGWAPMGSISGNLSPGQGYTDGNTYPMVIGDFNGDGKTDVGRVHGNGILFYLSDGAGNWTSMKGIDSAFSPGQGYTDGNTYPVVIGDFNGDGKTDVGRVHGSGTSFRLSSSPFPDLISSIKNGIGGTTVLSYRPSSAYPNSILPFVVQTVSSMAVNDGNNNISTTSYTYDGGLYNQANREFRGFRHEKVTGPDFTTAETWFNQDDIYKGLPYEQIVRGSNGYIYSRIYNVYDYTSPYAEVYFPRLRQKTDYLCDGATNNPQDMAPCKQTIAAFTYDSYGNIVIKNTYEDLGNGVKGDERFDYSEFNYDTVNWMVSQPRLTYVTDGSGTVKAQTWFTYDAKGNLKTRKAWLDGVNDPVTRYDYNSYGNQTSITDPNMKVTTIDYDSTYTYPVKTTNHLGHITEATYDYRFGKPLTKTDPNGNVTTYEYDVFGRLIQVTNPNDGISAYGTTTYYYEDSGIVGDQRVTVITEEIGGAIPAISCPSGGSYNSATGRCEAAPLSRQYQCPLTSTLYADQTSCTNACTQTASCNYGYVPRYQCSYNGSTYGDATTCSNNCYNWAYCNAQYGWVYRDVTWTPPTGPFGHPISTYDDFRFGSQSVCDYLWPGSTAITASCYSDGPSNPYRACDLRHNGGWSMTDITDWSWCFDQEWCNGGGISSITCRVPSWEVTGYSCPLGGYACGGSTPYCVQNYGCSDTSFSGYTCPLYGGSACSGSPSACSASKACAAVISCPAGYDANNGACVASPTVPANYMWKETYFDGLGRTIKTRSEGPDGKIIVTENVYDNKGRLLYSYLPYFESEPETRKWMTFDYDPIGRVTTATNPDTTSTLKIYMQGKTTFVDANKHMKVEEKDIYGRLVKVEEYKGVYNSPMNPPVRYAVTTYQYDILGNLLKVTDAKGNQTIIAYDNLSRKISMDDPDMGHWEYRYDANGNLVWQKDAKNQVIQFTYDALNRIKAKDYPAGTDVVYTYGEPFSTYSIGKLTTVTDASGSEQFYYDNLGRIVKSIKTVDAVTYAVETSYDALGRVSSIKYPDNEVVNYSYDAAGNLMSVQGYVAYSNFNAMGQAGTIAYANGVSTAMQYYPANNRLYSITTNSPTAGGLQNISYEYDNVGNVTSMTSAFDNPAPEIITYDYDEIGNMTYNSKLGAYTYGPKPHAVVQAGTNIYGYDPNGNMTSKAGGTLDYDYDNRLISGAGGNVRAVYDYSGQRVKKITPSGTAIYIGKLYRCMNGSCTKYIFAGKSRIAVKTATNTYYYHTDHIGSSNVITDQAGNKVEEIHYYPFGATRVNVGSVNVIHKFTGQEEDAELGLYYYGARYYDPALGRFISADTFVQNPHDPQDLNRYTYADSVGKPQVNLYQYAGANPVNRIDPLGLFDVPGPWVSYGNGGGNWLASQADQRGRDATNDGKTLAVLGGMVTGAALVGTATALAPEVYGFVIARPDLVVKINKWGGRVIDALSSYYIPGPPSSGAGYLGSGASFLEQQAEKMRSKGCNK